MKTKFTTLFFIVITKISFGQYQQYVQFVTPYLSAPIESGYFYLNTPNNLQAGALYQFYRLNAPDLDNNMLLVDTQIDNLVGFTHFKYQQLFKGIPVEGAGCIEHYAPDGSLSFINAKIVDSLKSDAKPRIKPEEAIKYLIEVLRKDEKNQFAWESNEWENEIQLDNNDTNATWYPTAELIFSVDTMKNMTMVISGSRYTLAYKISITTISPLETIIYHVDANNGNILKYRSTSICDGPSNIIGYGSRIIDTQWKGGFTQAFILETNDATRVIHTKKNPNGTSLWSVLNNTTDDDDNWGTSYDTEATTHYHVSNSWDYFRNVFGRTGQNNLSREIRVRTQWINSNADFTPEGGSNNRLRFGSTSIGGYYGAEPSVVGHEFTHGVTYHTSNLEYEYESGALNESFSDIFGIVIQAVMMDFGNTDWIQGNFVASTTQEMRSLKTPNNFGAHFDASGVVVIGQPDTYNGTFWHTGIADLGGVHVNSGVMNKWFFLLTEGEQGTNDLGDFFDINGIGMTRAARIAYLAQTMILQNSSQYTDARQATISAAIMLFGECSIEHQQTEDAWFAVGIGNQNDCKFTIGLENLNERDLLIYPNPTSNNLYIELPVLTNEKIQIFDLSGKLVHEFETDYLITKTDISKLQNGIYTIRFNFNGEFINKRIIVQK
jgi:Zn-dependent metalloprotease